MTYLLYYVAKANPQTLNEACLRYRERTGKEATTLLCLEPSEWADCGLSVRKHSLPLGYFMVG